MVVGLFALTDQIECVTDGQPHVLTLWSVIDQVLAGELHAAVGLILAIEADLAGGQRNAEAVLLGVFELAHHVDLLVRIATEVAAAAQLVRVPAAVVLPPQTGAIVFIDGLGFNPLAAHEFDLLGLLVTQGHLARQGVEMELVEGLLSNRSTDAAAIHRHFQAGGLVSDIWRRRDLVDVSRHELDVGIFEGLSGAIVESYPAHHVDGRALLGQDQVVGRLPTQPAGNVAELGMDVGLAVAAQLPTQSGLEDGAIPKTREHRLARQREAKLAVDLDDGSAGAATRRVTGAHNFALHGELFTVGIGRGEKIYGLALEYREQHAFGSDVLAVTLLENAELGFTRTVAKDDGIGLKREGCAVVGHVVDAFDQREINDVSDDSKVLVVYGERGLGCKHRQREGDGEEGSGFHGRSGLVEMIGQVSQVR